MLGRPTTKHTEKVVQKHTPKFKHHTRVVVKTAANSLAVGGGDNVIVRGKDEIKILQNSSKDVLKSIAH